MLGFLLLLGTTAANEERGIDELRVKRLILLDQDGRRRAMLGIETKEENPKAAGAIALIFYKNNDQPMAMRVLSNGDASLLASGKDGLTLLSGAHLLLASLPYTFIRYFGTDI